MLLAKLLPKKITSVFLVYLVVIIALALWLIIGKIMPGSHSDARRLTLPDIPEFTPAAFLPAKDVAAPWQIPVNVVQDADSQSPGSTASVRDQFEHQGKQYQLLGIFSAAIPFVVIKVLDTEQPDISAPAQQVKLHDNIGTLKVAEIGKNTVCLSDAKKQHCLYMFKSDVKFSKAQ